MSWLDADVQLYIGGLFESQVCAGMDALRAPIGRPPTRVGDGDYFVIFVLSFAVAQCLSSVFGTSFVSCEGFCIYYTIVHNCRTETPDLCLGGNSPPDCLHLFRPLRSELVLLPLLRFASQEISPPAGRRRRIICNRRAFICRRTSHFLRLWLYFCLTG